MAYLILFLLLTSVLGQHEYFSVEDAADYFSVLEYEKLDTKLGPKCAINSLFPPLIKDHITISPMDETDFGQRQVCIPYVKDVTVTNISKGQISVTGTEISSQQFQEVKLRKETILNPGDVLELQIVYIPQTFDTHRATLQIHTSLGRVYYNLVGTGEKNDYEIQPLQFAGLQTGKQYREYIKLTNPFSEMLEISKVYSTENSIKISIPTESVGQQGFKIHPRSRHVIMGVEFTARNPGVYSGQIHIKTNKDNIVVPVKFIVHKSGLSFSPSSINFGIISVPDILYKLPVYVSNNGATAAKIEQVLSVNDDQHEKGSYHAALHVENYVVQPGVQNMKLGEVLFKAKKSGVYQNHFFVQANDTYHELDLPYKAIVQTGLLTYNSTSLNFITYQQRTSDIMMLNTMNNTITIDKFDIQSTEFEISKSKPTTLAYKQVKNVFSVTSSNSVNKEGIGGYVILGTNIGSLVFPIRVYSGELQCSVNEQMCDGVIDFGIIQEGETSTQTIRFNNPNPIEQVITSIENALGDKLSIQLSQRVDSNGRVISRNQLVKRTGSEKLPLVRLSAGDYCDFNFELLASDTPQEDIHVIVSTPNKNYKFDVKFRSIKGSLNIRPNYLQFHDLYYGRKQKTEVSIYNDFNIPITLTGVTCNEKKLITPQILEATIEPKSEAQAISVSVNLSMVGTNAWRDIHKPLTYTEINQWSEFKNYGLKEFASKLIVNTDIGKAYEIPVKITTGLPQVIYNDVVRFPATKLNEQNLRYIEVINPSDIQLMLELVLAPDSKIPDRKLCRNSNTSSVNAPEEEDSNSSSDTGLVDDEEFEHVDLDANYSFCDNDFDEVAAFKLMTESDPPTAAETANELWYNYRKQFSINQQKRLGSNYEWISDNYDTSLNTTVLDTPYSKLSQPSGQMFFLSEAARGIHKIPANQRRMIGPILYNPTSLASHSAVMYLRSNLAGLKAVTLLGEPSVGRLSFVGKTAVRKGGKNQTVTARNLNQEEFSSLKVFITKEELSDHLLKFGSSFKLPETFSFQRIFELQNEGNAPIHINKLRLEGDICQRDIVRLDSCHSDFELLQGESLDVTMTFTPSLKEYNADLTLLIDTELAVFRVPVQFTLPVEELPGAEIFSMHKDTPTFLIMEFLLYVFLALGLGAILIIYNECALNAKYRRKRLHLLYDARSLKDRVYPIVRALYTPGRYKGPTFKSKEPEVTTPLPPPSIVPDLTTPEPIPKPKRVKQTKSGIKTTENLLIQKVEELKKPVKLPETPTVPIAKYMPRPVVPPLDLSQPCSDAEIVSEESSVGPQPPPSNDVEFIIDAYSDQSSFFGFSRRSSNDDDYFIDSYKLGEGLFNTLYDVPQGSLSELRENSEPLG